MSELYQKVYAAIYGHFEHTPLEIDLTKFFTVTDRPVVFDIGCGNGRLFSVFAERQFQYYGVDIDQIALASFKKCYPEASLSLSIEDAWPSPDLIVMYFNVLNYMTRLDFVQVLTRIRCKMADSRKCIFFLDFLELKNFLPSTRVRARQVIVSGETLLFESSLSVNLKDSTFGFEERILSMDGRPHFERETALYPWSLSDIDGTLTEASLRLVGATTHRVDDKSIRLILEVEAI